MKQRTFKPVGESSQSAPTTNLSKPIKIDRLAVSAPLPDFTNTPNPETQLQGAPATTLPEAGVSILIDARHVHQNSHPPRQIYTDEAIKAVADSIVAVGQRDPIHVIEHPSLPGQFIIGDGWTRVQAIRSYEINECLVLARVHSGLSEEMASWLGYDQNEQRSQHTDFDRAIFFTTWHKSGLTWEDIAARTGLSKTLLSFYACYEKLPREIFTTARNYPDRITATVAQMLSRAVDLSGESRALLLASRFISGDYSQRWLKDELAKLSEEKKPSNRRPAVNFQQRFGVDGTYKQRADGHIELKAAIAPERLEEFNARMVSLLGEFITEVRSSAGGNPEDQGPV